MNLFRTCASMALALAAASCFSGYRSESDTSALRVHRGSMPGAPKANPFSTAFMRAKANG